MRAEAKPFIPSSAATPASATETSANVPKYPSSCGQLRKISHRVNSERQCHRKQQCQLKNLDPLGSGIISSDSHDPVTFPKLTNQKNHTNEIFAIFEEGDDRKSRNHTQRIARRRRANQTVAFVQSQISAGESSNAGESDAIGNLTPQRQEELSGRCNQSKRHDKRSRKKQNAFCISPKSSEYDNPAVTRWNNSHCTPLNNDFLMQQIHDKSPPDERGRRFEKMNTANMRDAKQKQRRRRNRRQQAKYQKEGESANKDGLDSMGVDGNHDEGQITSKESPSNSRKKQHQQKHQRKNERGEMPHTTKHGKNLRENVCTKNGREWGERTNATVSNCKNLEREDFSAIIDNQTEGRFIPEDVSFPSLPNNITDAFSVSKVDKSSKRNLLDAGESCWASKVVSSVQLEIQQQQVLEEKQRLREEERLSGGIHLTPLSSQSTQTKREQTRNVEDKELVGASIQDQCSHEDAVPREHGIEESSINRDKSRTCMEATALTLQSPSARHGGKNNTQSLLHILPNAKLKWNEKEISNMRRRLWMALREKRRKEERVRFEKASQKEKLANEVDDSVEFDSSDDSSTSSSLSSSSSSSSKDQEENDLKQPPSLTNRPFDEVNHVPRTIPQQHNALPSRSVLDLEQTCRHSQHPIHYMICHMAMIKIGGMNNIDEKFCEYDIKKSNSINFVLDYHRKSDEETVLDSLLKSQDRKKLSEWRTQRVDPRNLYFEWRNKNSGVSLHGFREPKLFTNLLSADITSMTPLQLAVYWNLPKVIRALFSSATPETFASQHDQRPYSKGNKALEEDEFGRTSLMLACELRHHACIEALLSAMKVKIDHRDRKHGNTAFHYCCVKSLSEMDSNQHEEPIPQSSSAAEAIDLLFKRTPQNLHKRAFLSANRCGETILHLACASGDLVLVERLIKQIFEHSQTFVQKVFHVKNQVGHVPFLSAVSSDARDVVSHFLVTRSNAGVTYSTWFDGCPMTVASSKCSVEMVRLLLEAFDLSQSHTISSEDPVMFDLNNALIETIRKKSSGDGSEENDLLEIINLLVDYGANPHVSIPSRDHKMKKYKTLSDTPLCTAVTFGDSAVVKYMIDAHSSLLTARQFLRRNDPILRSQPESYFTLLEQKEWEQVQTSLQIATAKSLFLHWRNQSTISYGLCSLTLYKRVEFLPRPCLEWLLQGIKMGALSSTPNFSDTDSVHSYYFEAPFVQYGTAKNSTRSSNSTPYRGDRANFMQFSEAILKLNWFSSHKFQCKWLQNFSTNRDNVCGEAAMQSDEFYVVVQGEKLLAHKSICSAKCLKLAAAIRFYESNARAAEFHDGRLLVRVELPLLTCKMLLSHIYHGSIVFGLLESPMEQCDQILEMALIAEEYLCPSLMLECEMRLLTGTASNLPTSSINESSNRCICAHCSGSYVSSNDLRSCPIRQVCLQDAESKCIENNVDSSLCAPVGVYSVIAPNVTSYGTKLITPENAMNVLAVADLLIQSSYCQGGFYVIKYCRFGITEQNNTMVEPIFGRWGIDVKNDSVSGCLYKPFEAAKMTAIILMLRDFHSVLQSEFFFMQVQDGNSKSLEPSFCMNSSRVREDDAALLLRTCLDELAGCQVIDSLFNGPYFCAEAKTNNK